MTDYSTHLLRHLRLSIGRNIHTRRIQRRMELQKLAALTGIPERLLDAYELGKREIGLREILKIACALGVKTRELMG